MKSISESYISSKTERCLPSMHICRDQMPIEEISISPTIYNIFYRYILNIYFQLIFLWNLIQRLEHFFTIPRSNIDFLLLPKSQTQIFNFYKISLIHSSLTCSIRGISKLFYRFGSSLSIIFALKKYNITVKSITFWPNCKRIE